MRNLWILLMLTASVAQSSEISYQLDKVELNDRDSYKMSLTLTATKDIRLKLNKYGLAIIKHKKKTCKILTNSSLAGELTIYQNEQLLAKNETLRDLSVFDKNITTIFCGEENTQKHVHCSKRKWVVENRFTKYAVGYWKRTEATSTFACLVNGMKPNSYTVDSFNYDYKLKTYADVLGTIGLKLEQE